MKTIGVVILPMMNQLLMSIIVKMNLNLSKLEALDIFSDTSHLIMLFMLK